MTQVIFQFIVVLFPDGGTGVTYAGGVDVVVDAVRVVDTELDDELDDVVVTIDVLLVVVLLEELEVELAIVVLLLLLLVEAELETVVELDVVLELEVVVELDEVVELGAVVLGGSVLDELEDTDVVVVAVIPGQPGGRFDGPPLTYKLNCLAPPHIAVPVDVAPMLPLQISVHALDPLMLVTEDPCHAKEEPP